MIKAVAEPSQVNYSYATIKVTQSRLDKGLLAIPAGLTEWFPKQNQTIQVHLSSSPASQSKRFSSYASSTRECRIGGLKEWFRANTLKSGDEVVLQILDSKNHTYRLIPDKAFVDTTKTIQGSLDHAQSESQAANRVKAISDWTLSSEKGVVTSEFLRLSAATPDQVRAYAGRRTSHSRESVPPSLRMLLSKLHSGHCQICDFTFLKRDQHPYFETHHLDPAKGHHPKNVVVVCGNCHNQFEYASVKQQFDDASWLVSVTFNGLRMVVRQPLLQASLKFRKQVFV